MFKFIFYLVVIVIVGSYLLPANILIKIPYGTDTQRFTKQAVGWVISTADDLTGGVITNNIGGALDDVKEGAKDKLKEVVEDKIDEL